MRRRRTSFPFDGTSPCQCDAPVKNNIGRLPQIRSINNHLFNDISAERHKTKSTSKSVVSNRTDSLLPSDQEENGDQNDENQQKKDDGQRHCTDQRPFAFRRWTRPNDGRGDFVKLLKERFADFSLRRRRDARPVF